MLERLFKKKSKIIFLVTSLPSLGKVSLRACAPGTLLFTSQQQKTNSLNNSDSHFISRIVERDLCKEEEKKQQQREKKNPQ